MANASRDENNVPTLLAVSNVDGVTPVKIYADPTDHRLLVGIDMDRGVYTPTLTGVTNIAAATARECMFVVIGNMVTVYGQMDIDPTATATNSEIGISLPTSYPGALETQYALSGVASCQTTVAQAGGFIADTVNKRASLLFRATSTNNLSWSFNFMYRID